MIHRLITRKRDAWFASPDCTVTGLVEYIVRTNRMRDAQVEAIKTYLYLKIACKSQPLRQICADDEEAAYLLEEWGVPPDSADKKVIFKQLFNDANYADVVFSLPMGAGKTYLMAAMICLDLYFALLDPDNPAFAHNFIVFAPSGLKTSVIPSLKTIRTFDPSWIIPEPAATSVKRLMKFEVLDQPASGSRSNKTRNPNAQNIALYRPFDQLMGLVAVTNAEKVILEQAELRHLLGALPHLSILIDEVHHAARDEIRLRTVVNEWGKTGEVNSVIGFSGTPYLEKARSIRLSDGRTQNIKDILNTVYYYPLIDGIGNFLKRPTVKVLHGGNSMHIVAAGVREFLDRYQNTQYPDGLWAKLAVYCGTIERLEEHIYPLVADIAAQYGLDPTTAILKFHKGNQRYPASAEAQFSFDTLDQPISQVRIVLLVQIGKEGWDCRSLTGVILSQEGDCPKNMVLQTASRCLRQVVQGAEESALIYLNKANAEILNAELQRQHRLTLEQLTRVQPSAEHPGVHTKDNGAKGNTNSSAHHPTETSDKAVAVRTTAAVERIHACDPVIEAAIRRIARQYHSSDTYKVTTQDMDGNTLSVQKIQGESEPVPANFSLWLYGLCKESFQMITMSNLLNYACALRDVFDAITYENDGQRYFRSEKQVSAVNRSVRRAFYRGGNAQWP